MPWKKGERIPTNLIVGFLGSGKTTAIRNLINGRPDGENWSILINEFGTVSIDHALVESGNQQIAVEELGGGCACCTLAFAFKPLLAQFIRRTRPDRLILEPSGVSHPAKVVDILRSPDFASVIDLRNIICLIDPKDFDDPRWQESEVFQDQVQLADIAILNWTDNRDRNLIDRCREWVESFTPPKQLILETSFGSFDPELLDMKFEADRFPMFAEAHPLPEEPVNDASADRSSLPVPRGTGKSDESNQIPVPGCPRRFENDAPGYSACGWIFHVDDVFVRDRILDLMGRVNPVLRLKGVFRCRGDWWLINRAKDGISYSTSTYRRDSRLEIILDRPSTDWKSLEAELLECLSCP
ncbi:MAG: GTP-binding protein [Planctomycetota bacterium]